MGTLRTLSTHAACLPACPWGKRKESSPSFLFSRARRTAQQPGLQLRTGASRKEHGGAKRSEAQLGPAGRLWPCSGTAAAAAQEEASR